jgi:hypothetical protein
LASIDDQTVEAELAAQHPQRLVRSRSLVYVNLAGFVVGFVTTPHTAHHFHRPATQSLLRILDRGLEDELLGKDNAGGTAQDCSHTVVAPQLWRVASNLAATPSDLPTLTLPRFRMPTQTVDDRSRCFCGIEITAKSTSDHIRASHMEAA